MSNLTPSTRAALVFALLLTVGGIAVTGMVLNDGWRAAETAAHHELTATVTALAADPRLASEPTSILDARLNRVAEASGLAGIAVLADGTVRAATDRARLSTLDWPGVLDQEPQDGPWNVRIGSADYYLAASDPVASPTGHLLRVIALRSADDVVATVKPLARRFMLTALVAWLLSMVLLYALTRFSGARTAHRMQALAERLASLDADQLGGSGDLIEKARDMLGPLVAPFEAMAYAIEEGNARTSESRTQVASLLQINPHYVLVCTLDGHIIDANPAFYAMTGLPFEAVRGNRIEVLNEVMPVEPLFDLARRSFRESSSISGIEYAIINRDDVRRPVQISLRAVMIDGKEGVVIQATDVANQRNLERQISTFSDALDLMVDQRVAQLTAGNNSVGKLLDDAGVVLVSFDPGGSTRRWNQAAEALTGRRVQMVPHFSAFMSVLGLDVVTREAFSAWFHSENVGTFSARVDAADGVPRTMLWRKGLTSDAGRAERAVLIGMDQPRSEQPSGDSAGGAVPGLDAVSPTADHATRPAAE